MQDGDSFAGGTYPTPPEEESRIVNPKVVVEFNIELDIPVAWDNEKIKDYIKENLDDLSWLDVEVVDIDL